MVKLYKSTIIASIGSALCFFVCSILCGVNSAFAQNYFIGITCSLIVVVITSLLQYQYEQKKLQVAYFSAVREMISVLGNAFCGYEDNQMNDELCEKLCKRVKDVLDLYEKANSALIWFSTKKTKQQSALYMNYSKIYVDFSKHYHRSKRAAFHALRFHQNYIPLVDCALAIVQDEIDRRSIEDNKRIGLECLQERTHEEKTNR